MESIAWIANCLLVLSYVMVGERMRSAFLVAMVGNALWIVSAYYRGLADMLALCLVFFVLAVQNWFWWGAKEGV